MAFERKFTYKIIGTGIGKPDGNGFYKKGDKIKLTHESAKRAYRNLVEHLSELDELEDLTEKKKDQIITNPKKPAKKVGK